VNEAARAGRGIDDALFEEVGSPLGIGKTLASEYYYRMEKSLSHVGTTRISQIWRERMGSNSTLEDLRQGVAKRRLDVPPALIPGKQKNSRKE
jgi:hypothetical protein